VEGPQAPSQLHRKHLTSLLEGRRKLHDARCSRYKDMQESRVGEIRIINSADHKDKKVKNMLTYMLQGSQVLDSSRKQRRRV
jgi:hypothetical protein